MLPALLFVGLWGLYLGGVYLLFLAIFLTILALRDFLFPISYSITPEGISIKGLLLRGKVKWEEVEEISRENDALRLRLYKKKSPYPPHLLVVHLTTEEAEEIWKKIESLRKNCFTE